MEKLIREVKFWPAYDKRNEPGGYGQHCVDMRFYVKGSKGVVQFYLMTGWWPEVVSKPDDVDSFGNPKMNYDRVINNGPYAADLGYHSLKPMFEGQQQMDCTVLEGGKCYYDGSGLSATKPWSLLVHVGEEAMWKFLEDYYYDVFGKDE